MRALALGFVAAFVPVVAGGLLVLAAGCEGEPRPLPCWPRLQQPASRRAAELDLVMRNEFARRLTGAGYGKVAAEDITCSGVVP